MLVLESPLGLRTYLKMVDSMNIRTYKSVHAAPARRPVGMDSGAFSRGTHPRESPGPQAGAGASCLGGGALDSEHRCAMAPAAPGLPQLQNGASSISTVVRTRRAARDSHAKGGGSVPPAETKA